MEGPTGGRPKAVDIWEHVTELEGKRVKCKYCGLVFAASANRIKSHIYQIKGKGIRVCNGFPPPDQSGSNKRVNDDLQEKLINSQGKDIFAEILTDIERKREITPLNWYLPVTFSNAALSGDVSSFLDFVERQNIKKNYMSNLIDCEKMFIPVHIEQNSHGHFYLYIIDWKNQDVQIWDSLFDQFINDKERNVTTYKLLAALDKLFMDVLLALGCGWEFLKFQWRMANGTLLQPNPYDCGIFVINFMQESTNYVNKNPLFQFDSDEERFDLALKLLKCEINKERKSLYDKATKRHKAQGGDEEDSNLFGIKRKAYIGLDDSDRRVRKSNVGLEKGNVKGYILPSTDLVGEQFQDHIDKIWGWLMNDEAGVFGVWGMGGMGKTALVTYIHNKLIEEDDGDFDHVIWVTVSQHNSILQLQKVIAKSIDLDISDEYEVKRIAGKLLHAFSHMTKCVLILDDVWDHIFLEEVGFPILCDGNKLIMTTRLWDVCESMDYKNSIQVSTLFREDDGWYLFRRTLGAHQTLSPMKEKIGRKMIALCDGLPLAIVTLARSMKGKVDVIEWNHMLESLENLEKGQDDMDKWVFPILRSSYAYLNNKLQECFLYFALCARYEDGYVDLKDLTKQLVYEGLIDGKKRLMTQYHECKIMLNKIYLCSLLENFSLDEWHMHKLVKVMAVKEADKIMAKVDMELTEIPESNDWKEDLQKVILSGNKIQEISDGTSPDCSQLSTLLLNQNRNLNSIPNDFFIKMPTLKVLNLSQTKIRRLPTSISNLVCLTTLLLSGCDLLSDIPSLAKLGKLMYLDLYETAIAQAPLGLDLLINLRHLNLEGTDHLEMSTSSVIPKLTNLQCLHLNGIPKSMDVSAQDLQGLKELEVVVTNFCDIIEFNAYVISLHDRGYMLKKYCLTVNKTESCDFTMVWEFSSDEDSLKMVNFEGTELGNIAAVLPEDIKELRVEECHISKQSLCQALSLCGNDGPCKIESFDVRRCDEMVYLCCFTPDCSFCSSVQLVGRLSLRNLKDIQYIVYPLAPPWHQGPQFSHLRVLNIEGCNSMKTLLTSEFSEQLQNLMILSVSDCQSMKEIVSERRRDEDSFGTVSLPKVHTVQLRNLPELNSVNTGDMLCPSLQSFHSENCNKLRLPHIKKTKDGDYLQITKTVEGYSWRQGSWFISSKIPTNFESL